MRSAIITLLFISSIFIAACAPAEHDRASNSEPQKPSGNAQQSASESVANQNKSAANANEGAKKADVDKAANEEPGKAASADRKSVSGEEVTGTFVMKFENDDIDATNEIKIQALGGGKLKVDFDLIYPFNLNNEKSTANVGRAQGEASIEGDTAVYATKEAGGTCEIRIKFVKPSLIDVTQEQSGSGCGFGLNVSAKGTYKKTSGAKPKFIPLEQ